MAELEKNRQENGSTGESRNGEKRPFRPNRGRYPKRPYGKRPQDGTDRHAAVRPVVPENANPSAKEEPMPAWKRAMLAKEAEIAEKKKLAAAAAAKNAGNDIQPETAENRGQDAPTGKNTGKHFSERQKFTHTDKPGVTSGPSFRTSTDEPVREAEMPVPEAASVIGEPSEPETVTGTETEPETVTETETETGTVVSLTADTSKTPVEIIGVCFRGKGKVYYFSPEGMRFAEGDRVVVETSRGVEYAFVTTGNRTILRGELSAPLKPVLRHATEDDTAHYEDNMRRAKEAFGICEKKIAAHGLEMKLIDTEFAFDNSKILFYFTADGRVDFRELVKDLAAVFRTRIELRQIGIRDEAKMIGGIGVCGRPFCCHSFLPDFVQVSIKMAKDQNFSINSSKISGNCGRLMCCLHYEHETYLEEIAKTPKVDTVVRTVDGDGVVTEVIPLAGMVRVKPLSNLQTPAPKLYHRDDITVIGKMNWKTETIIPKAVDTGNEEGNDVGTDADE